MEFEVPILEEQYVETPSEFQNEPLFKRIALDNQGLGLLTPLEPQDNKFIEETTTTYNSDDMLEFIKPPSRFTGEKAVAFEELKKKIPNSLEQELFNDDPLDNEANAVARELPDIKDMVNKNNVDLIRQANQSKQEEDNLYAPAPSPSTLLPTIQALQEGITPEGGLDIESLTQLLSRSAIPGI